MAQSGMEMPKKNNKIHFRTYSQKHKDILVEAAKDHYTGSFSGFLKQWAVVIVRLTQAGLSAEWFIGNIDKVITFCRKEKE